MSGFDPSIGRVGDAHGVGRASRNAPGRADGAGAPGFDQMLAHRLRHDADAQPLKWSAHARDRLAQRGIQVTEQVVNRLEDAVNRADAKGARDSLVVVDQTAFLVSVENRVVITAVDKEGLRDQVFTNIDSAVLAP